MDTPKREGSFREEASFCYISNNNPLNKSLFAIYYGYIALYICGNFMYVNIP